MDPHEKRLFSVFGLVFAAALSGSAALADFYVIAVPQFARTFINSNYGMMEN